VADQERFAGGVDDLGCQAAEVVHGLNAFDLGDESVDEPEVAAGDADDGRDGGRVTDTTVGRRAGGRKSLSETAVSSSGVRDRSSWAKPMRL